MMIRRSFLAGALAGLATPALSLTLPEIRVGRTAWFVQVNCLAGLPAVVDDFDAGRCEVTAHGEFAGCCLAPTMKRGQDLILVPLSVGFLVYAARREDIQVKLYGALNRICTPDVRISELVK